MYQHCTPDIQNEASPSIPQTEKDRRFMVDLSQGMKALHTLTCPNHSPRSKTPEKQTPPIDRAKVAELMRQGGDNTAAFRYEFCHTDGMGWVGVCLQDATHEGLYHPYSCNDRACPICSRRRSAELASQITKPVMELAKAAPRSYRLRHLVLTTDRDLFEDETLVRASVQKWRKAIRIILQEHFARTDKKGRKVADKWLGGLIGAEFGEKGRKLHFHVLLLSRYIRMDDVLALWKQATGGHGYIGHVREVDSNAVSAIDEICKYATKSVKGEGESTSIEETLARVHFVLKGVRRLQGFGVFYNMARDETPAEACCPECGSPVMWMSELVWAEAQLWADVGSGVLDLKPVNNLSGGDPPKQARSPDLRQNELWL